MTIIIDGSTGCPVSPATGTLAVANGGTGVTTSTGSGANVLGTSPTITGATITVASTANPTFSAYGNAQSMPNATWTKINFETEEFDTNSNFASSRFTPTVAGYYQVNAGIYFGFTTGSATISVYKNGSEYKRGSANAGVTGGTMPIATSLVSCNGTTDYLEIYLYQNTGSSQSSNGGGATQYFNGSMVRSA